MCFFFFNDTPPTDIYTLSLHDALPIFVDQLGQAQPLRRGGDVSRPRGAQLRQVALDVPHRRRQREAAREDRKSTRLNSSHVRISYAVFCLKKKNCFTNT